MREARVAGADLGIMLATLAFDIAKSVQILTTDGLVLAAGVALAALAVLLVGTLRRGRVRAIAAGPATLAACLVSVLAMVIAASMAPARPLSPPLELAQLAASVLMLWRALALGRSITLLPAAIAPVARGPYALVRHPLYAAYLAFDLCLAYALQDPLVWTAFAAEALALLWRARVEERVLTAAFPDYAAYAARVRGRIIPWLL
jgi:protein-S-isoprenylcysteine O-methyltransferase Ste14